MAPDSVDGSKIKLASGESIRVVSGGSTVDLIKLNASTGKIEVGGSNEEVAIKSDVTSALALKADTTAVTSAISTAISNLVNGAPLVLDTLNELAAALGNDANYATTVTNALALKASIVQLRQNGGFNSVTSSGSSSSIDISTGARFTVVTGSSAHTMVLPSWASAEAGETFTIVNRSSGSVGVNHNASDSSGSQVTSLAQNQMFIVRVNASKTSWVGVKVPVLSSSNELSMASQKIINLATPTSSSDASTKGYVDQEINSLKNVQIANASSVLGVSLASATHLGTFTGSIIPDSSDVKSALQSLETAMESANVSAVVADLGRVESIIGVDIQTASHLGSFSGSTISSNTDVKSALQELETAVETKISSSEKGAANGVAPLNSSSKIDSSYLPSAIVGALKYKGVLDASAGSYPSSPEQGDYYVISVAGTISGNYYHMGDWAVYNGSSWDDIDNAQTITSVNSQTGAVVLDTDDISEGSSNLYYTSARFDSAFSGKDTDDLSEGSLNLYYTSARFNSAFSGKSTSDLAEGSNLYYTQARFDSAFSAKDSDDLSEGSSNLYFTEARVRSTVMTGLTLTSGAFDPADSLIVTLSKAGYQIDNHEGRIDALEAKVFVKEQITLSAGDITNGYVDLANQAVANSVVAFIDRLGMHQGSDFSVSVVSNKTRITFKNGSSLIGDGAEAPASGDVLSFTYYK